MSAILSESTITLIEQITRPLASSGAMHPNERTALLRIIKSASPVPQKERKLLTLAEAAAALSVSKKTITRMVDAGELDAVHLRKGSPRTIRITAESLENREAGL
ncbi:MAG: helix-turn-helix domain-containing protein [Limnospira sp. PMC 737.11]|uniref:helix-turn-helix domain-containing protein n=1 Tax=unclassified Limnospira TaxID=2642885 RepID=UPI0028E0C7F8|nr:MULTISPECIES: helix-turn-helix domain-containing protein [unclassified Limnospira]MDT9267280.1 helix-turn-helix domain-containing protein [Limnospira sp. PMC 1223.20]MDT9277467.1 helix-turn-helix domain-containing protein [Limnospira sp. PMC 737.11]